MALAVACVLIGLPAGLAPSTVIKGAAGAVFVAIVLADLTAGLMCFGLIAFFDELPGLSGGVPIAKAAGTLVALSWLATIATRSRIRHGFFAAYPAASYVAVLFVAWTVLSLTWATDTSAGTTAISRYALNLLLLPIAFTAIRDRKHVFWLVGILVVGATLSATYGMVFARSSALAEGADRLGGAGQDANYLASLLVSGLVLAVSLATIKGFPTAMRLMATGAVLLLLVALIDTVSRGGMLGLGAAMVAGIFFAGPRRRTALLAISLVVAVSVVGYYESVASPAARARITMVQGGSGRTDIWAVGWRMVKAHPIGGIGVGNFSVRTKDFLLQPGIVTRSVFIVDIPKVAHNAYLEILAETGIVGLSLFLAIVVFALACGLRAAKLLRQIGDRQLELVARAVVVATVGVLATDFFISDQFSKPLWIQLALGPCMLAIARKQAASRAVARVAP